MFSLTNAEYFLSHGWGAELQDMLFSVQMALVQRADTVVSAVGLPQGYL